MKPRLIATTFTFLSASASAFFFFRGNKFIKGFCLNQSSFASIGGRRRHNILTFKDLFVFHFTTVLYYLIEALLNAVFYVTQDKIGQNSVFFIFFFTSGIFDFFKLNVLPLFVLYRAWNEYPEFWANKKPQKIHFKFPDQLLVNLAPKRGLAEEHDGYRRSSKNEPTFNPCTLSSFNSEGAIQESCNILIPEGGFSRRISIAGNKNPCIILIT